MDINVSSFRPIEIRTRESSFLIYPEIYIGVLDLDLADKPISMVMPSHKNPMGDPKLDIYFNAEKGGFVIKDSFSLARHSDEVEDG